MMTMRSEPMQVDDAEVSDTVQNQFEVVESTSLDLETYGSQYKGFGRLNRLVFVADRCPSIRKDALIAALQYCMEDTFNWPMYQELEKKLQSMGVNYKREIGIARFDKDWVEHTRKKASIKQEKLDTDLKNYKSNSIKESIRRGQDDLGDHFVNCGDLNNALKCYSRARDYCTSSIHIVNMCLMVIKVSIHSKNWSHVHSYYSKADINSHAKECSSSVLAQFKCAHALASLANRNYKNVAKDLLQVNYDACDFPEILSTSDIAKYGTLCALASYDRNELHLNVISSASFKLFLGQEPWLREMLHSFHKSEYANSLKILEEYKDQLLLDMYLADHVKTLYDQIRHRALCQYFVPYVSANMVEMSKAMNTKIDELENEIMRLILEDKIKARIDSHNKVLVAKYVDSRCATFEKAFKDGKEFKRKANAAILRCAMMKSNIQIKSVSREESQHEIAIAPDSDYHRVY